MAFVAGASAPSEPAPRPRRRAPCRVDPRPASRGGRRCRSCRRTDRAGATTFQAASIATSTTRPTRGKGVPVGSKAVTRTMSRRTRLRQRRDPLHRPRAVQGNDDERLAGRPHSRRPRAVRNGELERTRALGLVAAGECLAIGDDQPLHDEGRSVAPFDARPKDGRVELVASLEGREDRGCQRRRIVRSGRSPRAAPAPSPGSRSPRRNRWRRRAVPKRAPRRRRPRTSRAGSGARRRWPWPSRPRPRPGRGPSRSGPHRRSRARSRARASLAPRAASAVRPTSRSVTAGRDATDDRDRAEEVLEALRRLP